MKRFFRNFRFSMFLVALLCVALGVALLLWPDVSQQVFCYAFAGLLIVSGLLEVGVYIAGENKGLLQKIMFVGGVFAVIVGVWMLFQPSWVLTLALIALGVVLLYHGVMDIKYAFDLKGYGSRSWGVALFSGLITCGVGVMMLVNPFENLGTLLLLVAIGFIFDGLTDLYTVVAVAHGAAKHELELAAPETPAAIEGTGEQLEESPAEPEHSVPEWAEETESAAERNGGET